MQWPDYHKALLGYNIRRKIDGCIVGKAGLFNKFIDNEEVLKAVVNGTHPDYTKENKEWFKDGEYYGPIESENKWKSYKNCPEAKPGYKKNRAKFS